MRQDLRTTTQTAGRHTERIARVLSKRGVCSRTEAAVWVRAGRVTVAGRCVRDPEFRVDPSAAGIEVDGRALTATRRVYIMLNKPRGLVTTTSDEHGRSTVYQVLDGASLPWLAPVGRLDRASEGLLLMSNDSVWAARITAPESATAKTYHVQIDRLPDQALLDQLREGVIDSDERLAALSVRELRRGGKNAWLELALDEGRNRHIRRLLAAFDIAVLRLVRVAIGPLALGELGKSQWRELSHDEIASLAPPTPD